MVELQQAQNGGHVKGLTVTRQHEEQSVEVLEEDEEFCSAV